MTMQIETTASAANTTTAKATLAKPFRFECFQDDLLKALTLVGRAMDRKSKIPILNHFHCRLDKQQLTITATDLDTRAQARIKCFAPFKSSGEFMLPWLGKQLSALTPRLGFTIAQTETGHHITIESESGDASLKINAFDPADFPTTLLETTAAPASYSLGASDFRRIIDTTAIAVSSEETRYYLQGHYFHCASNGFLRVVTTDGHRLVVDQIRAAGLTKKDVPIIVPGSTLQVVKHYCRGLPRDDFQIAVSMGDHGIEFDFGGGKIVQSKRIDGTFPDYQRVIPEGNDKCALFNNNVLYRVIDRFIGVQNKGKQVRVVRLELNDNKATISRSGVDGDPAMTQSLPCEYEGPALAIGFNPIYLRDMLRILDHNVGIAFADPGTACVAMSAEYPMVVIMPSRV